MSFQIIYISPELSKEYGATVNNVAGVLFVLSDKGSKSIQVTEAFLAERVCLSERMVRKAKALLRDNGYITVTTTQDKFKRSTVIEVTQKLIQAFIFSDRHDVPNDTAQCALSDRHEMSNIRHSMPMDTAQYAASDTAQYAGINKYKQYKKTIENNGGDNSDFEPNEILTEEEFKALFDEIPVPDEQDCEVLTPEVKSKRKRTPAAVPMSVDETKALITRYQQEHLSEPKVDHLDVHNYAVSIFDYYMAKGDTWRDKKGNPIKMPYRAVCNWINSDLKRGCLKTVFTAVDFERAANGNCIDADARIVNEWESNSISFED